jgi:hypothetical protein
MTDDQRPSQRPLGPEELWDRFIDALDRAGQAGNPAGVPVPAFATKGLAGRRFGDLSLDDVKELARVASALARRGETVLSIWNDMRQRSRGHAKSSRHKRR